MGGKSLPFLCMNKEVLMACIIHIGIVVVTTGFLINVISKTIGYKESKKRLLEDYAKPESFREVDPDLENLLRSIGVPKHLTFESRRKVCARFGY